jgi:hypothetical protein
LILAPRFDFDASLYHTVVFLDAPFDRGFAVRLGAPDTKIYLPADDKKTAPFPYSEIDLSRAAFGQYFKVFHALADGMTPINGGYHLFETAQRRADILATYGELRLPQFYVCLSVFAELGFFAFARQTGGLVMTAPPAHKRDLAESKFYTRLGMLLNK